MLLALRSLWEKIVGPTSVIPGTVSVSLAHLNTIDLAVSRESTIDLSISQPNTITVSVT